MKNIYIILTVLTVLAMATQTQAAETGCPLLGNPQLTAGGICKIATSESRTLVCALIDPSKSAGEQLVSGQDLEAGPLQVNWHITGGIGTVQLYKKSSVTINASTQYEVVVYDWNNATNCVKKTGISGSTITSSFNSSGINPTNTLSGGPTPTNQSSQSDSGNGQNNSLKESAINMMEAILDITNSNGTSPQPSPATTTTPSTTPLTPGTQPTSAPIGSTPNATYTAEAQTCLKNKSIYQQAAAQTGVPWEILAGIHYVEGGCATNQSLVSGRVIGQNEPDVHGNCSSGNTGLGKPYPIAGGCAFHSLLDTAIYGANHLIGKIGRIPNSEQDYAKALGRYNGTGNANCGRTPFASCPAPYEGYDHIYPMSKLDSAHQTMYLVYCADYTQCNPPKVYTRPGVLTIAAILQNN